MRSYNIKKEFLPPEEDFWAHCSYIQAWVENDYNLDLMHDHFAFSLLKELARNGVQHAREIISEEILLRFKFGKFKRSNYI